MNNHTITIVFACKQNAGRSQIAAAIARQQAPAYIHIVSAGTTPAEHIHPQVMQALMQRGLSPVNLTPQLLTDEIVAQADWVITMGCGEACPVYPGKHYVDWPVADPAHASSLEVEAIIADIEGRVRDLLQRIQSQVK